MCIYYLSIFIEKKKIEQYQLYEIRLKKTNLTPIKLSTQVHKIIKYPTG